jgi:hypothetical protein
LSHQTTLLTNALTEPRGMEPLPQQGWEFLIDSGQLEELPLDALQQYWVEFGLKEGMPATKLEAVVAIRQHNSAMRSHVVWGSGDGTRSV